MNFSTQFDDPKHQKQLKEYLANAIETLVNDYGGGKTPEEMNYIYNRIFTYLKAAHITVGKFKQAINEVLEHYPLYRTVNVAVIITAIYKVSQ